MESSCIECLATILKILLLEYVLIILTIKCCPQTRSLGGHDQVSILNSCLQFKQYTNHTSRLYVGALRRLASNDMLLSQLGKYFDSCVDDGRFLNVSKFHSVSFKPLP